MPVELTQTLFDNRRVLAASATVVKGGPGHTRGPETPQKTATPNDRRVRLPALISSKPAALAQPLAKPANHGLCECGSLRGS